eukprot:8002920-Heterocapsa_arctica.AAC.2
MRRFGASPIEPELSMLERGSNNFPAAILRRSMLVTVSCTAMALPHAPSSYRCIPSVGRAPTGARRARLAQSDRPVGMCRMSSKAGQDRGSRRGADVRAPKHAVLAHLRQRAMPDGELAQRCHPRGRRGKRQPPRLLPAPVVDGRLLDGAARCLLAQAGFHSHQPGLEGGLPGKDGVQLGNDERHRFGSWSLDAWRHLPGLGEGAAWWSHDNPLLRGPHPSRRRSPVQVVAAEHRRGGRLALDLPPRVAIPPRLARRLGRRPTYEQEPAP